MRKLLFALSFCCSVIGFAQVGVGTATPDASAQLDVKSDDKGILIPRLDIVDLDTAAPIAAANIKESLLAFNTNATTGKGFYFWDGAKWAPLGGASTATVTGGGGAPTTTNPANAVAGDMYVDETTGDIYTYDGTTWTNKSEVVSADADNIIVEGTDGLAYLDEADIAAASGISSGNGAPTATTPAGAAAGDIYVDEATGDIYTNDGNGWVKAGSADGPAMSGGSGAPTANNPANAAAGDMYVDEATGDIYTHDGTTWTNKSEVVSADADNIIVEGSDGLAFLDEADIADAAGTASGSGAPTATNPAGAAAGDIYVDEATGDIYTNDGNGWVKAGSADGPATSGGSGAPTAANPANAAAGDMYLDEATGDIYTHDGTSWNNQSEETVTELAFDATKSELTYTDEEEADTTVDLSALKVEPWFGVDDKKVATDNTEDIYTMADVVGIGTSTPNVNSSIHMVKKLNAGGFATFLRGDSDGGTNNPKFRISAGEADNFIKLSATGNTPKLHLGNTKFNLVSLDNLSGFVGIKTESPTHELHVAGGARVESLPTGAAADKVVVADANGVLKTVAQSSVGGGSGAETGSGAPTATNPANAAAGDMYIDEATGDIYTHDGTSWNNQSEETVTELAFDATKSELTYTDEEEADTTVDLSALKVEPWFGVDDKKVATDNTEDIYVLGKVGVGTDSPASKFHVEGGGITHTGSISTMGKAATNYSIFRDNDDAQMILSGGTSASSGAVLRMYGANHAVTPNAHIFYNGTTEVVRIYDEKTGIGTKSPTHKLTVSDTADPLQLVGLEEDDTLSHALVTAADGVVHKMKLSDIGGGSTSGSGAPTAANPANAAAGDMYVDEATGDIYTHDGTSWKKQGGGSSPWFGTDDKKVATDNTEDMYAMGKVGIGTDTPGQKFHIQGNSVATTTALIENTTAGEQTALAFKSPGGVWFNQVKDDATGKYQFASTHGGTLANRLTIQGKDGFIGIGTPDPKTKLHMAGTNSAGAQIRVQNVTAGPNEQASLTLQTPQGAWFMRSMDPGELLFSTTYGGTLVNRMTIKGQTGNVGIGVSAPTEKLHVGGNILATGTITPDYVFQKYYDGYSSLKEDYKMMSLSEIEAFTRANKHLPGVPSAQEVEDKGGILVNRATEINLEKIEELYLHTIEQQKTIEVLEDENAALKARLAKIEAKIGL